MYYTVTELINRKILADRVNLDSNRLSDLIKSDVQSSQKARMREGIKYYNARHDILDHVHYYYVEGRKTEDRTKANNRVSHPFFAYAVDEEIDYILSKPINVASKEPPMIDPDKPTAEENKKLKKSQEFQNVLQDMITDNFHNKIYNWALGAPQKGFETMHPYIDPNGDFRFTIVPAEQVCLIYDTQYQDRLKYVLRYYQYEHINEKTGDKQWLYKAEWWTDKDVKYYIQVEDGRYILDYNYEVNPVGHYHTFNDRSPEKKEQHGWGRVPFIVLPNNAGFRTDLQRAKGMIDAYDKVKSGWINDLEDFQELVYIVKGYQALTSEANKELSELAIFLKNVKTHKVISVERDGAVDTLEAEIPVEAKLKFLEITKREIFHFLESPKLDIDKLGNNPTGVALNVLNAPLDRKANRLINYAKPAIKELIWYYIKYYNRKKNKDYDPESVVLSFNKSRIQNDIETINALNSSRMSNQTYLEKHPMIDDAEEELRRIDRERSEDNVDLDGVEEIDEESQ